MSARLTLAKALYAAKPTYRGARPLTWAEAPRAAKLEWLAAARQQFPQALEPFEAWRVRDAAHELLEVVLAGHSTEHKIPGDEGPCRCGQCDFVRMRASVLNKIKGVKS